MNHKFEPSNLDSFLCSICNLRKYNKVHADEVEMLLRHNFSMYFRSFKLGVTDDIKILNTLKSPDFDLEFKICSVNENIYILIDGDNKLYKLPENTTNCIIEGIQHMIVNSWYYDPRG